MSTPAQLPPEAVEQSLRIAGMSCAACQTHVQKALASVPGVQSASVDLLANTALVTTSPAVDTDTLTSAVRKAGYDVLTPAAPSGTSGPQPTSPGELADPIHRSLGLRALLSLVAGVLAMLLSMPLMSTGPNTATDPLSAGLMRLMMPLLPGFLLAASPQLLRWVLFSLALGTILFAAPEIYLAAWRAARHRATNMNTLVALGTLAAFAVSAWTTVSFSLGHPSAAFRDVYFEAVVLILAFLIAGRWLEARARDRATASLRAFATEETGDVRWIAEGAPEHPESLLSAPETLLPLDAIAVGDIFRVLPGDRLPLDAVILAGRSSVDESMLTGEPLPATRSPGDKVFSGTLNLDGPLLLRATALGADSMQAQMARLLERARSTRAPLQRLADQVSAVFVPAVLGLAAFTFLVWAIADNHGTAHLGYSRALSLAISVLVVACPCAMGLAVPAAVAVSLGTAARSGMLIKGGEALERLATIDTVAFDKTGTLTEGRPSILTSPFEPGITNEKEQLLAWADALERLSTHPLAKAICDWTSLLLNAGPDARRFLQPVALTDARVLPGTGVEAQIDGHQVALGNASLVPNLRENRELDVFSQATPVYLVVDGQLKCTFFATDTLRPSAKSTMQELKASGVKIFLLTGDIFLAAGTFANQAGIDLKCVQAGLLPGGKLQVIEKLQEQGHHVAMVGDGINDAAALARADAGIAMASGTDLAREAGHVLLLHHDLRLVPLAIRLARRTRRLMRQNLGWALLYNVLGIPIAAGVLLPHFGIALSPALASAAMALSSVSVLLNSLRLANPPGR